MSIETTAPPFAVVWSTDPAWPCSTRYRRNSLRARWVTWRTFPTAEDARDAARNFGLAQFIPAKEADDA